MDSLIPVVRLSRETRSWHARCSGVVHWLAFRTPIQRWPSGCRRLVALLNWLYTFEGLEHAQASDPAKRYEKIAPDSDEHIVVPTLWACELYLPSYAQGLFRDLRRNGWDGGLHAIPGDETEAILRRARENGGLGWWPFAEVLAKDAKKAFSSPYAKRERLPAEFVEIQLTLFPLGSSLTAVVAAFRLADSAAASVDRAVRAPHEPRRYRHKGKIVVDGRLFVGIDTIQGAREALHMSARRWMGQRLPGVFACEGQDRLPVIDLLVREGVTTHDGDIEMRNYFRALGLMELDEASSEALPGAYLMRYKPERKRSIESATWTLHGRYESILDQSGEFHQVLRMPLSRC